VSPRTERVLPFVLRVMDWYLRAGIALLVFAALAIGLLAVGRISGALAALGWAP